MKPFPPITAVSLFSLSAAAENLCPCKFDGADKPDCRVFGQLGDDKLIPWHLAAIPSHTLDGMCRPPNANSFVNYLKFEVRPF